MCKIRFPARCCLLIYLRSDAVNLSKVLPLSAPATMVATTDPDICHLDQVKRKHEEPGPSSTTGAQCPSLKCAGTYSNRVLASCILLETKINM
jgi:hypothetical protein